MLDPSILVGSTTSELAFGPSPMDAAQSMRRAEEAERLSGMLAAIVDILSQLDDVDELSQAATIAARGIGRTLAVPAVVVAWRDAIDDGCRIIADTREAATAGDVHHQRIVQAAAEESASRGSVTQWPPEANKNRHAMMAIKQFAEQVSAVGVVAVPLQDSGGANRGAALLVGTDAALPAEAVRFLDAIAGPLATKLASIDRSQPSRLERLVRGVSESVLSPRRRRWILGAAIVAAVLLLPLRYRIGAAL